MRGLLILFAAMTILLCGCAAYGPERAQGSGFLGGADEYARMHQVPGLLSKAAYAWVKPGVNWSKYTNVYLKPVHFQFTDEKQRATVSAGDLERLKQSFNKAMQTQLGKKYPLVSNPGPGVLVIDPCLTSIAPTEAGRNIALKAVGLPGIFSGGVSAEMAFSDGQTGERVATFMDTKAGESSGVASFVTNSYTKWGNVDSAFVNWAKQLCKALDKAHATKLD